METDIRPKPVRGVRTFFTVWLGQLVSHLSSQLNGFALGANVPAHSDTH